MAAAANRLEGGADRGRQLRCAQSVPRVSRSTAQGQTSELSFALIAPGYPYRCGYWRAGTRVIVSMHDVDVAVGSWEEIYFGYVSHTDYCKSIFMRHRDLICYSFFDTY